VHNAQFQNILVVHFGQLGDVMLGLPALHALRSKFHDSKVTVMSGKSTAEVIALAGVVDEQIAVDRVRLRDGNRSRSIAEIIKIVRDVRSREFDLVVDLHSLPETNLLSFMSGAKHRLLARRGNRSLDFLSNFPGEQPEFDRSKHLADQYLGVLAPLGISSAGRTSQLHPRASDIELVRSRYGVLANRIGLFPGAGHPSRCWPLDNFRRLAHGLGNPVVFLGPEEEALRPEVESTFPLGTTVIHGLTLPQFVAALSLTGSFVTNDTGPLHLAAAVGTRVILLLDRRAPRTYLPRSENLIVIGDKEINEIAVDDVAPFLPGRGHPV
jgi:ADP-heptose:LPS heptosyltransferase